MLVGGPVRRGGISPAMGAGGPGRAESTGTGAGVTNETGEIGIEEIGGVGSTCGTECSGDSVTNAIDPNGDNSGKDSV